MDLRRQLKDAILRLREKRVERERERVRRGYKRREDVMREEVIREEIREGEAVIIREGKVTVTAPESACRSPR